MDGAKELEIVKETFVTDNTGCVCNGKYNVKRFVRDGLEKKISDHYINCDFVVINTQTGIQYAQ